MSTVDSKSDITTLRSWQDRRMEAFGPRPSFQMHGPENVTVLTYFYRRAEDVARTLPYTIHALYETWLNCGMMKTVLVADKSSAPLEAFASEYPGWITIQEEPSLVPGTGVDCMSVDCNSRLHERFTTPFVLIVQDDGFPLRPGIERFIGKYDFIGSPGRSRAIPVQILGRFTRIWLCNGGFSLRSRKICALASRYWNEHYRGKPFSPCQVEDIFYTDTLPKHFWRYRWGVHVAESRPAADFCFDGSIKSNFVPNPFGFHSAGAFAFLSAKGCLRDDIVSPISTVAHPPFAP